MKISYYYNKFASEDIPNAGENSDCRGALLTLRITRTRLLLISLTIGQSVKFSTHSIYNLTRNGKKPRFL